MGTFPDPEPPPGTGGQLLLYRHPHEWEEVGAKQNPNGTWSSLWACARCPDIAIGGYVGPVPEGYCPCGWVQRKPSRKKCENCKMPLEPVT